MKINVGDYVRIHGYIDKIININDFREPSMKYALEQPSWNDDVIFIGEEDIIKSSPNIIDLIEVGDYVNNKQIDYIDSAGFPYYEEIDENGYVHSYRYDEGQIKSIVTKEQFELMKYVVKED